MKYIIANRYLFGLVLAKHVFFRVTNIRLFLHCTHEKTMYSFLEEHT